jgi:alpha-L-rhamnosidase
MPHTWSATVIAPGPGLGRGLGEGARPGTLLRSEFDLTGPVATARLLVTALGVYEAELNGHVVGDEVLAPGWTSYRDRHRYQSFDVTGLLRPGSNAWGAHLADGWYRGRLGFNGGIRDIFGPDTGLLAELHVAYQDGGSAVFTTGPGWRPAEGPILSSGIYEDEEYDARREHTGWSEPGFDDTDDTVWHDVRVLDFDTRVLFPADSPPVRRTGTLARARRSHHNTQRARPGRLRAEPGRPRAAAGARSGRAHRHPPARRGAGAGRAGGAAAAGRRRHRPVHPARGPGGGGVGAALHLPRLPVRRGGRLAGRGRPRRPDRRGPPLRPAPHRLVRELRYGAQPAPQQHRLGHAGNYLDVPTDCPQRDERLGWACETQVFAPTATFLYDVRDFLRCWLRNLAADQARDANGVPPLFSPQIPVRLPYEVPSGNALLAGWCDAAVIVPWVLYERYGDTEVLREQYPSMRSWVDAVDRDAGPGRVWDTDAQLGDWLDPTAPPDDPGAAATSKVFVATAYFARSAALLARTAEVLGHQEDAEHYRVLADEVRAALLGRYHAGGGLLTEDAPTAYALALRFDLLTDDGDRAKAGARLAELVAERGHRISTGFLGTPVICDALTDTGHIDTAYRMLFERSCPSWMYQVDMDATTVWERWDSMRPDGTLNTDEMTSFNHYAFGAVADWRHRRVAGLAPDGPGYRRLLVRPRPGGGLTWARAIHDTPYGRAEVHWRLDDDASTVDVDVPPTVTATVDLPGREPVEAGPGHHVFRLPLHTDTTTQTVQTAQRRK